MYIIRDTFLLKFGQYSDAKLLLDHAYSHGLLPDAKSSRVLTDFTGDSYRLIFEEGFDTLAEYEQSLSGSMQKPELKKWYEKFNMHITSSHREVLKQIM